MQKNKAIERQSNIHVAQYICCMYGVQ